MALSWNEIRTRTLAFQKEWSAVLNTKSGHAFERQETHTFYNDFFNIFGISRRRVASFEEPVKKIDGRQGFIDLFWKGMLLVEQKSEGKKLSKAKSQAFDYFPYLKENELPRFLLVSDFANFELYDLESGEEHKFSLADLHLNIEHFGFIAGYETRIFKDLEPVNIEAAELMGALFDKMKTSHPPEYNLELFLVRLLFCLFADDTGIFERDSFKFFIEEKTKEDGSDVGSRLQQLFDVLNTRENYRPTTLDESLQKFPYINGRLFETPTRAASFDSDMRKALLDCCYFNWNNISPAIFGSLFQSVADRDKRRSLGEHYTSEKNILKTISPLFLDQYEAELDVIIVGKGYGRRNRLLDFRRRLSKLKFLDPACGCGNFLVITYREIRRLELRVIRELYEPESRLFDNVVSLIDVDNFYGIEIEEFPAKIAEVALWLTDHTMNIELSQLCGKTYARIPLQKTAKIVCGNALTIDWETVAPRSELSYILGNPPFLGARVMGARQKQDLTGVFGGMKDCSNLDYVTAWYRKAAEYIQDTTIEVGFVSTNSICQGQQAPILWRNLFMQFRAKINFAHQTFKWSNEASGNAAVYCIIVGFAMFDRKEKRLYHYDDIKGEPKQIPARNINAYLVDADNIFIEDRKKPLCDVSEMVFGSMPNDGGNFLLSASERDELIKGIAGDPHRHSDESQNPLNDKGIAGHVSTSSTIGNDATVFIRPLVGAEEFINGIPRFCIWLKDVPPNEYSKNKEILRRIENVKKHRQSSTREATRRLAAFPMLFGEIRQPDTDYLLIPSTSSESRKYVPIGFMDKSTISTNANLLIPNATLYEFGVLTSSMHNAWMRCVCGRLESRYRYSASIVYNNFVWCEPTEKQRFSIEQKAQNVLDIRAKYENATLADLYNPLTMPADLLKAHAGLDRAVESAYGKSFTDDAERVAFLFEKYRELSERGSLFKTEKPKRKRLVSSSSY